MGREILQELEDAERLIDLCKWCLSSRSPLAPLDADAANRTLRNLRKVDAGLKSIKQKLEEECQTQVIAPSTSRRSKSPSTKTKTDLS